MFYEDNAIYILLHRPLHDLGLFVKLSYRLCISIPVNFSNYIARTSRASNSYTLGVGSRSP